MKFAISIITFCSVAIFDIFNNVVWGRLFSASDFGLFKFVMTTINLLSMVLIVGQGVIIIRGIGRQGVGEYAWKKHTFYVTAFSFLVSVFLSFLITSYYGTTQYTLYIILYVLALVLTGLISEVLRIHNTILGVLLKKFHSIVLSLVTIAILYYSYDFNIAIKLALLVPPVCIITAIYIICKKIPSGRRIASMDEVINGAFIFITSVSYIIIQNTDKFCITKIFSMKDLAGYSACFTIAQGYALLSTAIWYIMLPRILRAKNGTCLSTVLGKKEILFLVISLIFTNVFYFLFGKTLLSIVFKGKFDEYSNTLYYLYLLGNTYFIYSFVGSYIGALASRVILIKFVYLNIAIVVLNLVLNILLLNAVGVSGAPLSTSISVMLRSIVGIWLMRRYIFKRASLSFN